MIVELFNLSTYLQQSILQMMAVTMANFLQHLQQKDTRNIIYSKLSSQQLRKPTSELTPLSRKLNKQIVQHIRKI